MANTVIQKIAETCERLGEIEVGGIKLESADAKLLDVSQLSLDTHVAIQPAAVAYYGSLKKEAGRRLSALHRGYSRWEKRKYAEAKASLGHGTGKNTVADIEARYIVDNEAEIEKWEEQEDKAQLEFDTLDVWFEAWRQKSYSIREHAGIVEAERYNNSGSLSSQVDGDAPAPRQQFDSRAATESSIKRVKTLIRQRHEGKP